MGMTFIDVVIGASDCDFYDVYLLPEFPEQELQELKNRFSNSGYQVICYAETIKGFMWSYRILHSLIAFAELLEKEAALYEEHAREYGTGRADAHIEKAARLTNIVSFLRGLG